MKVELQHVTKIFPSRENKTEKVVAVSDFTFTIPDGKLIGLLGPSGCGKSTTLNMISGLEKYAITKAVDANRYQVENKVLPKYNVSEYDLPIIEEIYEGELFKGY